MRATAGLAGRRPGLTASALPSVGEAAADRAARSQRTRSRASPPRRGCCGRSESASRRGMARWRRWRAAGGRCGWRERHCETRLPACTARARSAIAGGAATPTALSVARRGCGGRETRGAQSTAHRSPRGPFATCAASLDSSGTSATISASHVAHNACSGAGWSALANCPARRLRGLGAACRGWRSRRSTRSRREGEGQAMAQGVQEVGQTWRWTRVAHLTLVTAACAQ